MANSLRLHGLDSPWNSPGQNTEVGNLSLLQGIFPTQRLNPGLLHCRQILYQLSHKGSPHFGKISYFSVTFYQKPKWTFWVEFSCSVVPNSLQSHGLQYTRPPCLSPTPGVYPNSCPLVSQWCHPTISSSVIPFSSCPQSFPASFFSNELVLCIRWPKYWSFSFSICPSNEYSGWISFRIACFDLLAVQGTLKSLLHHNSSKRWEWHTINN